MNETGRTNTRREERGRTNTRTEETGRKTERSRTRDRRPTDVNYDLERRDGSLPAMRRADRKREAHDEKWKAIRRQARLTKDEVSEVITNFGTCDYDDIAELSELLGEMRVAQGFSGGGKMVGGNPTTHFLKLQRWLTAKFASAAAISDCAKWFINKILDGLTAIGRATVAGASIAFSASMDLARTALGHNDTQTFQYLLAFCGMFTSVASNAGEKVHNWLQRARAGVGAAAGATSAAFGVVVKPYTDVFTRNMIDLLNNQQELFVGKIPGVNTPAQFDTWLTTLTMGDFMTATANIIAAGKWAPVAIATGQIAGGLVLTTGYYGILAAAWISDSYILTGTWLTYQVYSGLPVAQKESITEAFKAVDEYLAKGIDPNNKQTMMEFMKQIKHLEQDPIAKALVVARLKGEMTEATVKRDAAMGEQAHVIQVQALTTALGGINAETATITDGTINIQMATDIQNAMGKAKANGKTNGAATGTGADAHPIVKSNTPIAKGNTNINTAESQTRAAAAGWGGGATPGATGSSFGATDSSFGATGSGFGAPSGAQPKMVASSVLGTPGGKRATRKRGKRSSKRAPRKTKTTRKKRRGKK